MPSSTSRRSAGGRPETLRQPLRLCRHRAQHVRQRVPHGLHVEARSSTSTSTPSPSRPRAATTITVSSSPPSSLERISFGTSGDTPRLTCDENGDRVVTTGNVVVHAPAARLQRPLVSEQRRAAMGMASRQHALRRVAAESRRPGQSAARVSVWAMSFARSRIPGTNIFLIKTSFWLPVS